MRESTRVKIFWFAIWFLAIYSMSGVVFSLIYPKGSPNFLLTGICAILCFILIRHRSNIRQRKWPERHRKKKSELWEKKISQLRNIPSCTGGVICTDEKTGNRYLISRP